MSEQATVVAPTPESTPVQAAPEATPQEAPQAEGQAAAKPIGRKEAFRAMQERMARPTEVPAVEAARTEGEVVVDVAGRKHDPQTGKFLAENGQEVSSPAAPGGAGENAGPKAENRPTVVRLELPEALRKQGEDFWEVPAKDEERARSLINGYTRRAAVEEAERRLAEAEQRTMRLQAEQEIRARMFAGPEFSEVRAKVEAVKAVDPELAALIELGLERKVAEQTDTRLSEISQAQWGEQVRHAGDQAERSADMAIGTRYPLEWLSSPDGQRAIARAKQQYVAEVWEEIRQRPGQAPQFSPQRIVEIADFYAIRDPWMRNHLTGRMQAEQSAQTDKLRKEAEEKVLAERKAEEASRSLQTAQRRDTMHPMGRIASQVRSDRQSVSTEGPSVLDVPPHQRRNTARERAISRGSG